MHQTLDSNVARPSSPVSPGTLSPVDISVESVPGKVQQWKAMPHGETRTSGCLNVWACFVMNSRD